LRNVAVAEPQLHAKPCAAMQWLKVLVTPDGNKLLVMPKLSLVSDSVACPLLDAGSHPA
jgi:hypothetical protein